MKRIFILLGCCFLAMTSCKKMRTFGCTCTSASTGDVVYSTTYERETFSEADDECRGNSTNGINCKTSR